MRYSSIPLCVAAAATLISHPRLSQAISPSQIDNFEDSTTQSWVSGLPHPAPPVNISTGGPLGLNDNYLQLTSTGDFGAGGRMVAFNSAQWLGDFTTAGVTKIRMNLNNFGSNELSMRLMFDSSTARSISTQAVVIPAGSGWITADFPIAASDLTASFGTSADSISNVTKIWFYHNNAGPTFQGPNIAAVLGVDNITALPEPASPALVAGAGLILINRRLRKRDS